VCEKHASKTFLQVDIILEKPKVTKGFLISRHYILIMLLNGRHPCRKKSLLYR